MRKGSRVIRGKKIPSFFCKFKIPKMHIDRRDSIIGKPCKDSKVLTFPFLKSVCILVIILFSLFDGCCSFSGDTMP